MIDSHCHLAATQFTRDLHDVVERASAAGVSTLVTIADDLKEADLSQKIAEKYDHIFYTAGVHPHHAKTVDPARDLPRLRAHASHPKCRAIGEIGLDYHYMNSEKSSQLAAFSVQLQLAQELSMPTVIHTREAIEDTWTIVNEIKPGKIVLHCCTEKWSDVQRFVERGYLLSFTGIATYPKSDDIRETIRMCPLDRMMVETDAPFLAPVPHRGKRCEPAHVVEVAKLIARIKNIPLEDVDSMTTANAVAFYGLPS